VDVDLELRLEERLADRVRVVVSLAPVARAARVEGATLQLVDAGGSELCPRTLLPVQGRVTGPMSLLVELRTCGALPRGARVVASAWTGRRQIAASCPADPYTTFRDHLVGAVAARPVPGFTPEDLAMPDEDEVELLPLDPELRSMLPSALRWIDAPVRPTEVAGVLEAPEEARSAADLASDLGLDAESAAWLEGLLDDDEVV
jgi:hypothetical protein